MDLYYISATGNTFLVLESTLGLRDHISDQTRQFFSSLLKYYECDSLLLTKRISKYAVTMRVLEKDLSESLMCGNGVRALSYYYGKKYGQTQCIVKTLSGNFQGKFYTTKNTQKGESSAFLRITNEENTVTHLGYTFQRYAVGEPHALLLCTNKEESDLVCDQLFTFLRKNPECIAIDGQTYNYNIIYAEQDTLFIRTFERGVNDETQSCGTGTTASIHAYARHYGQVPSQVVTNGGQFITRQLGLRHYELRGQINAFSLISLPHLYDYTQRSYYLPQPFTGRKNNNIPG